MKKFIMILFLVFSVEVHASSWTSTTPGTQTFTYTLGPWDRSQVLPSQNHYFLNNHVAAFGSSSYNKTVFLCRSTTNTSTGACPSSGLSYVSKDTTTINLQFTEKKSLVKKDLQIIGWKVPRFSYSGCPEYTSTLNSNSYSCSTGSASYEAEGVTISLYMPQSEINQLPFGGIWEATLVFTVRRIAGTVYGTYTMNITVDLTDKGNIQVWVPGFHSDPRVDLNLRPEGNGRYTGTNTLDMCFYDGYSTNSNSMEIRFQDDSGSSASNTYYLNKTDEPTNRLPYSVALLLGGRRFEPENGTAFTINDSTVLETNWERITAVSIPEINVPVLCWPARLLFSADVNNPTAGQYSGNIRITFTPSSENL